MREHIVAGAGRFLRGLTRHSVAGALAIVLILAVTGCALNNENEPGAEGVGPAGEAVSEAEPGGMMPGMGMGRDSGMMERYRVTVPSEYASLTNPVEATEDSLERGGELYTTYCATCHGDGGMGDGPTAANLDPAPVAIAHTAQMMGDNYLFWRISEGGAIEPFNSAMPAWKGVLDEQQRWDVINYVRALGAGTVMPRSMMGGAMFDPAAEQEQLATMLETAVVQEIVTQAEADTFMEVHAAIDGLMASGVSRAAGSMDAMQQAMLNQLVNSETITAGQAATFNDVHDRLIEAGLMQ
ncbi:MAG: cytochrome c [Anaerolineae bacterium]|nr:cytochrome c [Anaerolineae bacterium]